MEQHQLSSSKTAQNCKSTNDMIIHDAVELINADDHNEYQDDEVFLDNVTNSDDYHQHEMATYRFIPNELSARRHRSVSMVIEHMQSTEVNWIKGK